ncbi:ABC transporter substrate-binding protein [Nonomuraea sp. NPDC059007]|uniref:ABC transporter substrate-binding protein n=1 Tax=Nonomuraea sp. NPDC059007 TaxID=3346692 RepID=UPI0036B7DEE8
MTARLTAVVACLVLTACTGPDTVRHSPGQQKADLVIGVLPIIDVAPVYIADKRGLFRKEGLNVKIEVLGGGADALPRLIGKSMDISFGNYLTWFNAQAGGLADLKVVADGYHTGKGTHRIVAAKDSPIRTLADLSGKKIAVNALNSVPSLLVRRAAGEAGVKLDDKRDFVAVPFPEMIPALENKQVDAAFLGEPFAGAAAAKGMTTVAEIPAGFPVAGYAATAAFVKDNPDTVAAFQRAMAAGARIAADRVALGEILPTYVKGLNPAPGGLAIGTYPQAADAATLQGVSDTMARLGYFGGKRPVRAADLITPAR